MGKGPTGRLRRAGEEWEAAALMKARWARSGSAQRRKAVTASENPLPVRKRR
jgi:hypothetical protein